jgi:hypothetical protein
MRLRIGDVVTVKQIPPGVKKLPLATKKIFRHCLGRAYTVRGFDRYGHIELRPKQLESIWVEREFVSVRRRKK